MGAKRKTQKSAKKSDKQDLRHRILAFLNGEVVVKGHRLPNAMLIGLLGVVLAYVGIAGIVSTTTPWWLGRGDAPRHIDYVYSIYNGEIPRFHDPLQYHVFNELRQGNYSNQPAAVNPPLFYALHAPIVGPLLESDRWEAAIAAGRALNIFFGVICIGVLAWAGWIFGGKRKALFAVAVPAMSVLTYHFTALNQNYAVDVLLVIFTTLSLISSYKILKFGLKKNYLVWLALLSLLGMSTKATYVVFLFTSLLAVVIAAIIHGKEGLKKNAIRGLIVSGLIFLLILLTIGWYYYFQNYRVSGNWVSAAPENFGSTNREYKSFETVLTSSSLWGMFYERIMASAPISMAVSVAAFMGVGSIFDKDRFRKLRSNKTMLIMVGLILLATAGTFSTQITHAVGYGGYYFRYMLPAILAFGLFLTYGLTELKWTRGQLVTVTVMAMGLTTLFDTVRGSAMKVIVPGLTAVEGTLDKIYLSTAANGLPVGLSRLLLLSFVVGVAVIGWSVFALSGPRYANGRT